MLRILLITILTTLPIACGAEPFYYDRTPLYGFYLSGEKVDPAHVDYIASAVFAEFGVSRKEWPDVFVELSIDPIPCLDNQLCAGVVAEFPHSFYVMSTTTDCLAKSALAHELIHIYLRVRDNRPDSDHTGDEWRKPQERIYATTRAALCSPPPKQDGGKHPSSAHPGKLAALQSHSCGYASY